MFFGTACFLSYGKISDVCLLVRREGSASEVRLVLSL